MAKRDGRRCVRGASLVLAFAGMTKPLPFSESRVRRVIAAVRKEGLADAVISIRPDGTITIHQGIAIPVAVPQHADSSEWEDIQA
jgi:hypothetical protein